MFKKRLKETLGHVESQVKSIQSKGKLGFRKILRHEAEEKSLWLRTLVLLSENLTSVPM